jgi:hypothetical protein
MKNCFYSNRLIWGCARFCGGNSSTTSSFFVLGWLSIFWITNGCSLVTSLCLPLWGSIRCANRLSCRFVDACYNLNCTTALLTGFNVDVKNPLKSLRPGHRLVLLCPCFSCSVGNACLALFRKDRVIVTRADCLVEATPWRPPREGRPAQIRHENASD